MVRRIKKKIRHKIRKHIISVPKRIDLMLLYGALMFMLGMWLNHVFSSFHISEESEDSYQQIIPSEEVEPIENEAGQAQPDSREMSEYISDVVIKKGDTFSSILEKSGISRDEINAISAALKKVYNLKNLKIGQKISFVFREATSDEDGEKGELKFVLLKIDEPERYIEVSKGEGENYNTKEEKKQIKREVISAGGVIDSSLYMLAKSLDVPPNIMRDVVQALSFDVDFQRDIQSGSRFQVLYEGYFDLSGNRVKDGNVIYAMVTVGNKEIKVYRFGKEDVDADFYDENGRSVRKSLLKTPIDGAIISSPYGVRRHPILGYTKMHKGVDFAAPTGTPIFAAGEGVIEFIGRYRGYGNYIRIKHTLSYSTAYGHMSGFAKSMKRGRRVKQGQVIGFVGSTGASTGPHLHYEILVNGEQVNPMKIAMPPGRRLDGQKLADFKRRKQLIDNLVKTTPVKFDSGV